MTASLPRAVLFDLYGTLIDIRTDESDPRAYATLSQYLAYWGVAIAPGELAQEYRTRLRVHFDQSSEQFPEVDVTAVFREIMTAHRVTRGVGGDRDFGASEITAAAVLFRTLTRRDFTAVPGAHQVLEHLQTTYRLGLISDAQWVFTEPEIEIADLARFFPVRILSSRLGVRKPDPRPFLDALRALGVAPEAAVYVGDSPPRDLAGARSAGIRCVLFRGECVPYNGLVPDACFHAYADLEAIVDGLLGR